MQQKEITNESQVAEDSDHPRGRIISIDPGTKRIGLAVCDETRLIVRPLPYFTRSSWKKLLAHVSQIIAELDATALVIGLPLDSEGEDQEMTTEAREVARKFALSLTIPVLMQDERVSSYAAKGRLWEQGVSLKDSRHLVDSEAAVIILEDFLSQSRPISGSTSNF